MKASAYLPVWVRHLPASVAFSASGALHPKVQRYVKQGVVRVIAGPEKVDLCIDVQRPYFRPSTLLEAE